MVNLGALDRFIAPLKRQIAGMLAKGVLFLVDDSSDLQTVQVKINGETHDGVERLQPFGLTSVPIKGAQVVISFIGGKRDNPVAIVVDDGRYRIKLEEGEVAVYNTAGAVVKLSADGTINLGDETALTVLDGVVTGQCIDPFTGAPHADKSMIVRAKKV